MVAFVLIVVAVIVIIVVVKKNKRKKAIEFLMNQSASHAVVVRIKDALVSAGYEVTKQSIEFLCGMPTGVGVFVVSNKERSESGDIYFFSGPNSAFVFAKNRWTIQSIRIVQDYLYGAEISSIGLLVTSYPPNPGIKSYGYAEVPYGDRHLFR